MSSYTLRHKTLSSKQLAILQLLYRFRFGTTELIAQALDVKTKNKMNERLKILLDQEYISRNYKPEYRLLHKSATYYLLPKGIKVLRQFDSKCSEVILHNIYKDKSASEQFIGHSLGIFKIYCALKSKYGDGLRFSTKSQLQGYDYFPQPLPDAFIRVKDAAEERRYFLELLQSARPFFIAVRKARRYIPYSDGSDWEETGTKLPTVLLACDSSTMKSRIDKHLAKIEDDMESDGIEFLTTMDIAEAI